MHAPDEGDEDLHDDVGHRETYQAGQPAAQERAEDSNHDVPDQPKTAAVSTLPARKPAIAPRRTKTIKPILG